MCDEPMRCLSVTHRSLWAISSARLPAFGTCYFAIDDPWPKPFRQLWEAFLTPGAAADRIELRQRN